MRQNFNNIMLPLNNWTVWNKIEKNSEEIIWVGVKGVFQLFEDGPMGLILHKLAVQFYPFSPTGIRALIASELQHYL